MLFVCNYSVAQDADIIGNTDKEQILKTAHESWFTDNYSSYNANPKSVERLTYLFKTNDFKVEVYFGTWCSDSQREIPKLYKLLEESGFDFKNFKLIGVNEYKELPNATPEEEEILNITNVPTIIVYENGKEINRFVEYAQESLEKDLIKIFSKKPYKHSYQN